MPNDLTVFEWNIILTLLFLSKLIQIFETGGFKLFNYLSIYNWLIFKTFKGHILSDN